MALFSSILVAAMRPEPLVRSLALALAVGLGADAATAGPPDPLDRARSLHAAREWIEALAEYRAVIAGSTDSATLAIAHNNACSILTDQADLAVALRECEAALEHRRRVGDELRTARTLNNLGRVFRALGRYGEAESVYREALEINERLGDVASQALNRANLGMLAMATGRYGEAMSLHRSAQLLAEQNAGEDWAPRQILIARLNQGAVLEKLGAYREALEVNLDLLARVAGDPELAARVETNLGVVYRNLDQPLQAIEQLEKAAVIYGEIDDVTGLSNARLNLALVHHLNLRRLDEAEPAYREALDLARESGDRSEIIQNLFYLGNLQLELGQAEVAEKVFQECFELSDAGNDSPESEREMRGSAEGRWSSLYGLGRVAESRGEWSSALELYRQAMVEIEWIRAGLVKSEWRAGYFAGKREIYGAAVKILGRLHAADPDAGHDGDALEVVQRAKARVLLDLLADARLTVESLDADTLRRLPGPGEVLLEYFRTDEDLYVWTIRDGTVRMRNLGPAQAVLDRVRQVHAALASGNEPDSSLVEGLSRALYFDAETLGGARRLRVAPDGALGYLPFEILPVAGRDGVLLLDELTVTYLPSASTQALLNRRAGPGVSSRQLLGFADPELPYDPEGTLTPASLLVTRLRLEPLPAAARELETVGRLLTGTKELYVGGAATEAAFRRAVSEGSRIVHLATHTVVDERLGQGAAIVLGEGDGHDGLLSPREILTLEYAADLTVLASCRSALDETGTGEAALTTLTGSFLAAGSAAVVATLWEIDDDTAAVFMEQFYYQLSHGHSPAEALSRAKMRLRQEAGWDRPDLWSAYILVGEGAGVVRYRSWSDRAWLIAGLLLAAGLAVALRRRPRAVRREARPQ